MSVSKKNRSQTVLYVLILVGFVLGVVFGLIKPGIFDAIGFMGDIYVRLLKILVVPLLMVQVAVSVYRTAGQFAGRLVRVILLFIAMFVVSFLIMTAVMAIVRPGEGVSLFTDAWEGTLATTTVAGFFTGLIPDNIFAAMSAGSIMPCILFAFAAGLAAAKVKAKRAMDICDDLSWIFSRMLAYVMWLTPLGVFSLMGSSMANYGTEVLGTCARYILLAWGGCLLITLLVMILPVWIYARIDPITYIRRVCRIWVITLSTCSSAATLPNTIRVCNEEFGVPSDITGIVAPLGCTIHMCGGAVSFCLLGFFTMQMAGVPVTFGLFMYMLFVATLMNLAAPGISSGGIVLGATYLTILGAPTGFIGLYSGIYRLLDMAYTTVNVTGDVTANILIAEGEKRRAKN